MFGTIKEYSKGVLPCVIAHILIDSLAAAMLVGSNIVKIGILVAFEIAISIFIVKVKIITRIITILLTELLK